jgi:antitoxin ParD1/3/4
LTKGRTLVWPTSVALGDHFEAFVKAQIANGRYNNVSEVVRDGLRLLEDREALRLAKLEKLRLDIQAGLDSGSAGELDVNSVKRRGRQRLAGKTK